MPDDLLRHVIGPTPYSAWWLWTAVALTAALVLWYVGVFVLTKPGRRLRDVPLVGAARDVAIRHRAVRAVREIGDRYRGGELEAAPAAAAVSREVRRFLNRVTGAPAEYMQLADIPRSEIAAAATLLENLVDVQFNAASELDVARVGRDAEELIRSWT
ncbi:hypothetical protein EAH80_30505 [Mycobacterium hodleri]|uniref:DUF4129 domain-containing protein n=1 Tax=Mycolicibacterium hodleri TaxID=49897 RepID=A0A502DK16_9MYCO|nr:hypothetical protein [Mycolicibacterium hodleri]TPG25563.1 hypothetical protein EAH80_30505 [Mycolicibacterium hodleri]